MSGLSEDRRDELLEEALQWRTIRKKRARRLHYRYRPKPHWKLVIDVEKSQKCPVRMK